MSAFTIDFEPVGRRGECSKSESLLACAHQLGVGINSICGGEGTCNSCKIQVLSGTVSKPRLNEREIFTSQELKEGWRLACQTYPDSDCKIAVPTESMTTPQRVQVEGLEVKITPEPSVRVYLLQLSTPSLEAPQADDERLLEALNQQYKLQCTKIDVGALRVSSGQLRSWNWKSQAVVRNDEVIAVLPRNCRQLGLAIDLGTTKIAGYLVDLDNGKMLTARGMMNPQINYGEDIISRISRVVKSPDEGVRLQKMAVDAINEL
jgi:uncharacterized 2Fe-2S/4Fe-4S cluster protein (DUF4445 family)